MHVFKLLRVHTRMCDAALQPVLIGRIGHEVLRKRALQCDIPTAGIGARLSDHPQA